MELRWEKCRIIKSFLCFLLLVRNMGKVVTGPDFFSVHGNIFPSLFHEALAQVDVSTQSTEEGKTSWFFLLSFSLQNIQAGAVPQVWFSKMSSAAIPPQIQQSPILHGTKGLTKMLPCPISNNGLRLAYKLKVTIVKYLLKVNVGVKLLFSLNCLRHWKFRIVTVKKNSGCLCFNHPSPFIFRWSTKSV